MIVNTRLCARLVVEGVLSNLAFQRTRLPLAWGQMQPLLRQSPAEPVRQLARNYSPSMIATKQKPVVDLFDKFFFRRGETELQALQLLADNLELFTATTGLMLYFDFWKEVVASRWDDFQGAMFHSARLATLETSDAVPLRDVLDKKTDWEGLTKMGIEVPTPMKTPMIAPLIEFARAKIGTNTKIAVLSPDRNQSDLIIASLLRLYPLLDVARWDGFAQGLRPVTVFGLSPDLKELRSLDVKGAWCVIDASGGIVNDNLWDSLIKFLKPALQFGIGRSNELHYYPVVARVQELGLDAGAEPEPGPPVAVTAQPQARLQLQPKPQPKAKPKPQPAPKPKPKAKATPQPAPKPKPKAKLQPAPKPKAKAKPQPAPQPKPQAKPAPAPQVEPPPKAEPVPTATPASLPEPKAEPVTPPEPALRSFSEAGPVTEPAATPQTAAPTMISPTAPMGEGYARKINHELARRAFGVAASKLADTIKAELHKSADLEARRALLRMRFEQEARVHYNKNLPAGTAPARFLSILMKPKTGDTYVLGLMRELGLRK